MFLNLDSQYLETSATASSSLLSDRRTASLATTSASSTAVGYRSGRRSGGATAEDAAGDGHIHLMELLVALLGGLHRDGTVGLVVIHPEHAVQAVVFVHELLLGER